MSLIDENGPEMIEFIQKPELIIGLVGPVGVQWDPLINIFKEAFTSVDYTTEDIRLSKLFEEIFGTRTKEVENDFVRLNRLMDQGDAIRRVLEHPEAAAFLCVAAIQRIREQKNHVRKGEVKREQRRSAGRSKGSPDSDAGLLLLNPRDRELVDRRNSRDLGAFPIPGQVYVLRSLKTPAEVQLLRKIYGQSFFLIAAYSSHDTRIAYLADRISGSCGDSDSTKHRAEAEVLNARDEKDRENPQGKKYGQNVQDTFPLADLFVDMDDASGLKKEAERFVQSLFGYQFHTPSRDEYGMFHAMAGSRRSADLSRQVGAAVTTSEGDVIAVGCNEVPKAGGGLYWAGDPNDRRDFVLGRDVRHEITDVILLETIRKLKKAAEKAQSEKKGGKLKEQDVDEMFSELEQKHKEILQGARVKSLLEFGRTVHAEMAALSEAALRGTSVRDGTMYVTTLPCHLCARHIVATGIIRTVYIEPYPKSMVRKLYPDSICIDNGCSEGCVEFKPFLGFAPRIYLNFFDIPDEPKREYSNSKKKGEEDGKVIPWDKSSMKCRVRRYVASYLFIEMRALKYLGEKFTEKEEVITSARRDKTWHELEKMDSIFGKKRIDDWTIERKDRIQKNLKKAPGWMKCAILAHKFE